MAVINVAASDIFARVFLRGRLGAALSSGVGALGAARRGSGPAIEGREAFVEGADQVFARSDRYDRALLRIDVDPIESTDEGLGAALHGTAARTIRETIVRLHGEEALFARISAAEFAALVAQGSSDEILVLADAIRDEVRKVGATVRDDAVVTASIGVVFCLRTTTANEALEVAELALGRAKANGRDQWRAVAQGGIREVIRRPRHTMLTRGPTRT